MARERDYRYLLSMEEYFHTKEHPYNVKVVRVRRLCQEIVELEERLDDLREELKPAVEDMMRPAMKRRIRRG